MKERNKKGFTLIELLAVIVILAIIALIAVPIVMNLISKARKSAAEDSAYGMVKAAETYYAGTLLETSGNGISKDLIFSCTKDGCKIDEDKELTFNGSKPSSGTITIKTDGKVQITDLIINNYTCNYKENSTEIECLSSGEIFANNIVIIGDDGLDIGETMTLSAIIAPEETTNKNVIWESSDENVATITENGEIAALNYGVTTITATTSNGKSVQKQIIVYRDFTNDSWETIKGVADENKYFLYRLGDTKTVDMGSFGSHTVRVSNITPCDGSLESETACGFVIEFADIIVKHIMNSSKTNKNGWPGSKLYTYLNADIYNALPEDLRKGIIKTKVISGHGPNDSSNFESNDFLYLISTKEIWNDTPFGGWGTDSATDDSITRRLDYYSKNDNTEARKKLFDGEPYFWWLRAADLEGIEYFMMAMKNGNGISHNNAATTMGVSPSFRYSR